MRFFLDHDVPDEVGMVLHTCGHQVVRLREELLITTPDEAVWAHVCQAARIVISCNRRTISRWRWPHRNTPV